MEPYEIAAFLGAAGVVPARARPGHAVTVQQAGGDVRSALHIRWPVVELVIERDTNIGRASFAGPQRLAVALTTMKWVDGQLTHVARGAPLPRPHTQLCIRYAYDMRAYAMLAAGEVPALYSYAELCRQLLVDIVRPWAHTSLLARTGAPPAAEDLLADMPWNVLAEAVDDFRRAAHECATLHDLAPATGWARLSAPAKRVAWFARGAGAARVALLLSGAPTVGVPLLGFRVGGGEQVALSTDPADWLRGVWMLQVGPRWFARGAHPFARGGADLRWVCAPMAAPGLLRDRAENVDVD